MPQNYLALRGEVSSTANMQTNNFKIKIVIPQGFPHVLPKVFLDQVISMHMLQSKNYLGQQNVFKVPYLTNWVSQQS